jgi:hypothetical protein
METLILLVGIVGFCLLSAFTVILVVLNWSEKTLTPVVSILVVGMATTAATVVVQLKRSTIDSMFVSSIVFDTGRGNVVFVIPDAAGTKVNTQLQELIRLSHPTVKQGDKTAPSVEPPTSETERIAFCRELLQYRIVHAIRELQRGGSKSGFSYGRAVASVDPPLMSSDSEDYDPSALLLALSANRFSNSDGEKWFWQHTKLSLPPKTTLHIVPRIANRPGEYVPSPTDIVLEKPLYFQINIAIETLPYMTYPSGIVPEGLNVDSEVAKRCETFHYRVTMRATFQKLTAGSSRAQEYKDWVNRLFEGLKNELAD